MVTCLWLDFSANSVRTQYRRQPNPPAKKQNGFLKDDLVLEAADFGNPDVSMTRRNELAVRSSDSVPGRG